MKDLLVRFLSRKFLTTLAAHGIAGWLVSRGHVEAAAAVSGLAQGTYNIGQGMADAAKGAAESDVTETLKRTDDLLETMMHGD